MLTKFLPLARTVNTTARQQIVRCMGGHAPANWKSDKDVAVTERAHMNDLPVPQGSWQEAHSRRNAKWNTQLGVSIVAVIITIFAMNQCNCFYLHDIPPLKKN